MKPKYEYIKTENPNYGSIDGGRHNAFKPDAKRDQGLLMMVGHNNQTEICKMVGKELRQWNYIDNIDMGLFCKAEDAEVARFLSSFDF